MVKRLSNARRMIPASLGVLTIITTAVLFTWDIFPKLFPPGAHDVLASIPLVLIAVAYLDYQAVRQTGIKEFVKAILLALAFLFWALNQLWSDLPQSHLFNDLAIVLFVLDMFLVIMGWPSTSPDEGFAEAYVEPIDDSTHIGK